MLIPRRTTVATGIALAGRDGVGTLHGSGDFRPRDHQRSALRINVVTGSASGIGKATKELLESRGERVIGVDRHNADVNITLETAEGRQQMIDEVTALSAGTIDAIFSIAGVSGQTPMCASVNYFSMPATLTGLRPLLLGSDAPRAVLVSSVMSLYTFDEKLLAAFEAGDEPAARARG
ncbi:MAG: Rossmann-fold NAD(P)-binding domain-containing protein [Acidimicrobiales bacterium]